MLHGSGILGKKKKKKKERKKKERGKMLCSFQVEFLKKLGQSEIQNFNFPMQ